MGSSIYWNVTKANVGQRWNWLKCWTVSDKRANIQYVSFALSEVCCGFCWPLCGLLHMNRNNQIVTIFAKMCLHTSKPCYKYLYLQRERAVCFWSLPFANMLFLVFLNWKWGHVNHKHDTKKVQKDRLLQSMQSWTNHFQDKYDNTVYVLCF